LVDATGQDRKTIIANIGRLREWGLITDTGERRGVTKQIVVYKLRGPDMLGEQTQKRNSPRKGSVPFPSGNSPVFGREEVQKRDTEPSELSGTECVVARAREDDDRPRAATLAGKVCRQLTEIGIAHVNPGHANLRKLLAADDHAAEELVA